MKPHRTDGVSLSFGLIFLAVAIWWAASQVITVHLPAVGWVLAGGLILFGAIGLLGAIRSGRRTREEAGPTAQPEPVLITETPGGLPPEMHASIVQELMNDPATRFQQEHPAKAEPEKG
jgi:hypothetical protein